MSFLLEDISLSTQRETVDDAIEQAIQTTLQRAATRFNSELFSDNFKQDRVEQILQQFIPTRLKENITNALSHIGTKITPLLRKVKFGELHNEIGGSAEYDTINIQYSRITDLSTEIIQRLMDILYDTTPNRQEYAKIIYNFNSSEHTSTYIKNIRDVFLHEMVHITQHARQPTPSPENNWKNTEYRSYLTNSKKKFQEALHNLLSKEDWDTYYASPQEIPAHAHNMALNLIDITGGLHKDYDVEDMKYVLALITDLLKDYRNWTSDPRLQIYSTFNKPGTKEYKIFKRFMNVVYMELYKYKEYVAERIKLKIQQTKNDTDYDNWMD